MTAADPAGLTVDVVICTYSDDRWGLLEKSVRSALAQTIAPQRVVVCVDHNPALYERCQSTWAHQQTVQVVENAFAGRLGSARNTALLQCSADIVAFLDDDAEAAPDWLARLLEVYTDPRAVAVGGAPRPNYGAARPRWFPAGYDWVFGCHYQSLPDRLAPVRHLIGANMSVRRAAILAEGGFHADDHDDMDLSHRIAHSHGASAVLYEPRAEVCHFVAPQRLTWHYFWRRCFFVNRSKVGAFADMGDAGNLGAELRFGIGVLTSLGAALVRACLPHTKQRVDPLMQAAVSAVGLALAAAGHLMGRAELAFGRRRPSPTSGLPGDA